MSSPMPTTKRRVDSDGPDFYPTPEWVTQALLQVEQFKGVILEPACGDGAITRGLEAAGHEVKSSDLYDRGFGLCGRDFLLRNPGKLQVENIVTNPPYNLAEKFVLKALELTKYKVALFLRLAFLESITRYDSIFSKIPPARIWVFSERVTMYPSGQQTAGSGTTAYAWFVWDSLSSRRGYTASEAGTQLGWIPPGSKPKAKKRGRPALGLKLADLGLS